MCCVRIQNQNQLTWSKKKKKRRLDVLNIDLICATFQSTIHKIDTVKKPTWGKTIDSIVAKIKSILTKLNYRRYG